MHGWERRQGKSVSLDPCRVDAAAPRVIRWRGDGGGHCGKWSPRPAPKRLPIQKAWISMRISILSVPMDLGQNRHGVDMGPSAVRYADLDDKLRALGHEVVNLATIHVPDAHTRAPAHPTLPSPDPTPLPP